MVGRGGSGPLRDIEKMNSKRAVLKAEALLISSFIYQSRQKDDGKRSAEENKT